MEAIANVRGGDAPVFGHVIQATAVNPESVGIFNLKWTDGSDAGPREPRRARRVRRQRLREEATTSQVGSPLDADVAERRRGFRSRCTASSTRRPAARRSGRVTISDSAWDKIYDQPQNIYSFVQMKGGETDANKAALEQQLSTFPNAKVQTKQEFIDNQIGPLNAILNVLYVLLALSVVVSLFGIVNTLVLTVFERTRELGMLRAVGMTRRQVRRMIRHESVITALIGGALGIALGLVLGALLAARVEFIVFTLPVTQLIVFAVATIIVGIVAAIFPARRAARLNILEALQYE